MQEQEFRQLPRKYHPSFITILLLVLRNDFDEKKHIYLLSIEVLQMIAAPSVLGRVG
jgi:hypothetical protein